MIIGEVGHRFEKTQKIEFLSHENFFDFDLIIIDLDYILFHLPNCITNDNLNLIHDRCQELYDCAKLKYLPIIYFTPIITEREFNGYGNQLDIFDIVPTPKFTVTRKTGNKFNITQNTPLSALLNNYKSHIKYQSYFDSEIGLSLMEIPLPKKNIAIFDADFIFLPKLADSISSVEHNFLNDLYNSAIEIKNLLKSQTLPKWCNQFKLPSEKELSERVIKIENKINSLNLELKNLQEKLESFENIKRIFTETGFPLESIVKNILVELGMKILPTEQNRTDIIIEYQEKVGVIEIKGVTKSAAEKNAVQLDKWASIFYLKNNHHPKPILIVNSLKTFL
jgi:hypothetical protein